jgi:hypothetical protein
MKRNTILDLVTGLALMLTSGPLLAAGPPPNGGTVFVTATNARDGDDTPTQISADAVSKALGAKGFTFLDEPGHAAYVADVIVRRTDVGTGQERVHAGGASMMGSGVSVPFSTGQSRFVPLERTEVEIRIRRRGETTAIWRGAAVTVRSEGSPDGAAENVALALSAAALRMYPRELADTVGVP